MSSVARRSTGIVVLVTAIGSVPPPAAAQVPVEELIDRVEALRPGLEEARQAQTEARARRRAEEDARRGAGLDTIRVGPLRIVTPPDQAELTAGLFSEVMQDDFRNVASSPAGDEWLITFQWSSGRLTPIPLDFRLTENGLVRQLHVRRVWEPTRDGVKDRIRDVVATVLTEDFPQQSPMRRWLGARSRPEAEQVYRALAATPSGANRACFRGEPRACWPALGLGLTAVQERFPEWFSPGTRQRMVEEVAGLHRTDPDDPAYRACVEDGVVQACDEMLADTYGWSGGSPMPDPVFSHVLWHAVELGGEGAWGRALERRDAAPAELLTHVAGVDAEELAASWRTAVLASPPQVHADLGRTRWSVLIWSLVLLAFAMRSTRWRSA